MARIIIASVIWSLLSHSAAATELKLTKVSLFSSGVGCFEAAATVNGAETAELHFRIEQINDILKSLVLRDLDGGTFSAVEYPSLQPIDKTLKSFGVDITGHPSLAQLLDQLRGVRIEVKAPGPVIGLILGVEKQKVLSQQGEIITRVLLNVLTDDGVRTFVLSELAGIKLLDPKIESELRKALATLATSHNTDKKTLVLNFQGKGRRRVRVDYLVEMPVWKTTYRLMLGEDGKAFLQGWAIVENTTEQDWENVRLNLVSGRPISFAMDLYQSLYVPRPVEQMAMYQSLRPPEYAGGLGGGRFLQGGGDSMVRAQGGAESLYDDAGGDDEQEESDGMLDLSETSGIKSLATAQAAGELFEYSIKMPVTLKRQNSAMLPIVASEIQIEKLSIYNPAMHSKYPLNGIRFKNATGLHLMQGPVTLFDGNAYAGDAKLPDLRTDEERLLAYALDLGVEVTVKKDRTPEEVVQTWIGKGTIWQRRKLVDQRVYTLRNKDNNDRIVLIEQSIGFGWKMVKPKTFDERTASGYRFKVELPARETKTLTVRLEKKQKSGVVMSNVGQDNINIYLRSKTISTTVQTALRKLIELRNGLDETTGEIESRKEKLNTISTEQDRIRRNMQVLDRNSDVYHRYVLKFDHQETNIEQLRQQITKLQVKERDQRKAIDRYIMSLDID